MSSEVKKIKTLEGIVVSKTDKSVKVKIGLVRKHPKYGKIMKRASYIWAHDENNAYALDAKVFIKQSRPYSKLKRWIVVEDKSVNIK